MYIHVQIQVRYLKSLKEDWDTGCLSISTYTKNSVRDCLNCEYHFFEKDDKRQIILVKKNHVKISYYEKTKKSTAKGTEFTFIPQIQSTIVLATHIFETVSCCFANHKNFSFVE